MRRWIFRLIAVIGVILSVVSPAQAQELADSVGGNPEAVNPAYLKRLERHVRFWNKLMPDQFVMQYAGDFGMISAGAGWDYGRSRQWETHLLVGFTPGHKYYHHFWSFTLREMYSPWRIHIKDVCSITPLTAGISVNSILDGDFWTKEPDRYPKGYYGFSSRVRFHIGLGQRFTYHIPEHKRFIHSSISFYYEVSTCDLYVRQKFLNSSISLGDIIVIGLGLIYTL